jgi:hypothetical protein
MIIRQFGLAVEHTLQDQVIWNGQDGKIIAAVFQRFTSI